jgi:phytoene dehydrogenase-like protein
LIQAHQRRAYGQVADRPTLLIDVPSLVDPLMSPATDRHVLSLEVLFTPYNHPGGWSSSTEPDRWLDLWAEQMVPGARDLVMEWRVTTPDRYETEFSMHQGYSPAWAGSPLDAFLGRAPELTRYRTPIGGLFLTGAGTYPGAGIIGASGRNAARVVLSSLRGPAGGIR